MAPARVRPSTSTASGAPDTSSTRPDARPAIARRASGTAQRVLGLPMIERASSTSRAPAGVTLTPECERSNNVMPNSASKPDTCLTSAGVDTPILPPHAKASQLRGGRYGLESSIVHVNLPFSRPWPHGATGGCFRRSHTQSRTHRLASYKPTVNAILTNMQFTCANAKHTITSETTWVG